MNTKSILMIVLLLASTAVLAQNNSNRFGIELNSGISVATKKLDGAKLNPGFGFEGTLHYRFMQHLGVYAGWGWNRFSADNSFAGGNTDFEETGYVFGIQFNHLIGTSPIAYHLRMGGLYNHIETENGDDLLNDSKHGLGWQVAGGLNIPLRGNWSLTPGVRFSSLSRDIRLIDISRELNLNYISFRIGVMKVF